MVFCPLCPSTHAFLLVLSIVISLPVSRVSSLKIAFVGDTGIDGDESCHGYGHHTMDMIQEEGVDLVVDVGDFDYWGKSGPKKWDSFLRRYDFDFLGASGNADVSGAPLYGSPESWAEHQQYMWQLYKERIVDNNRGICRGYYDRNEPGSVDEYGERYSCFYGENSEHHIIFLGWNEGCRTVASARDEIEKSIEFIDREFSSDRRRVQNTQWRYCVHHQTTAKLSAGGSHENMDLSGITDACRRHGAIILSGHHHIYARTKVLRSVGGENGDREVLAHSNQNRIQMGRTISLTVGMGGYGGSCDGPFADADWMTTCVASSVDHRGALIAEYDERNPREATFRYKNSMADGEIVDEFTLSSHLDLGPPTNRPTREPTTRAPTDKPTKRPTNTPTKSPTKRPTDKPTPNPTDAPTETPTRKPTYSRTNNPTNLPTAQPSSKPSREPTYFPSPIPSHFPTDHPSVTPSDAPSDLPSRRPTTAPSEALSVGPPQVPSSLQFQNTQNRDKEVEEKPPLSGKNAIFGIAVVLSSIGFVFVYKGVRIMLNIHPLSEEECIVFTKDEKYLELPTNEDSMTIDDDDDSAHSC